MALLLPKYFTDKEFSLYQLLKLKKKLEYMYFSGYTKIDNYKDLIKASLSGQSLKYFKSKDIITLIHQIEQTLNLNFAENKVPGEKITIKSIRHLKSPVDFLNKLCDYNSQLEKFDCHLIVQGSYADDTYTKYSDIDLVIIGYLKPEIIDIKNNIEKEILHFDPLQHHGVFFINKNSFSNYWQNDLPVITLKKSKLLSFEHDLTINFKNTFVEKYSSYFWLKAFIHGYKNFPLTMESGAFYAKYFLSQLMLVPTMLLAVKGQYTYKGDSFEQAKKLYSEDAWNCMIKTSEIRKDWNTDKLNSNYVDKRKNLTSKKLFEWNTLGDMVVLPNDFLDTYIKEYQIFINETKQILNEI